MNSTQDLYLLSSLFYALINSDSFSPLSRLHFHSSVSSHPASTNSVRHSSQKHFKSSPYVANPFVSQEIWSIFLLENSKENQIDKENKSGWKLLLETLNDGSIAAVRNLLESLDSTKNSLKTLNPIILETTVIALLYIRYFAEPWMSKLLSPSSKSTQIINSFSTNPTPRPKELLDSVIIKLKHERLQGLQYPKFWASVFTNCNLRFYDVEVTDPVRNTTTLHPFSLFWNGILELIRISQLIKQNYIPNVLYTYPTSSNGFEKQLSTDAKRTIPPEKLSTLINESISTMASPHFDQLSNSIKQLNLSIISNFGIHMPLSWFHPKLLDYSMSTVKRIVPPASDSNLNLSIQDLQILHDAFFVLSCWIRRRNRNDDDNPVERYLGYSDRIINLLNLSTQNSNHTKDYESILAKLATSNFIGLSYIIAPSPTSPPSPSPIANPKSAIVSLSTSLLGKLCKSPYSLTIMNSEYYFPTLSHLLQFFSSETVKSVLSALLTSWDAALPDQTDLNVIRLGQNPELEIPELAIRWYQCFQYAWKKRIEDNSHVKSKQNGHSELEIWFHNVVNSLEIRDMTRPESNDEKMKETVELKSSLQYVMSVLTAASVFRIFTTPELQFHKLSFTKSYAKLEEITITGLASIPSLNTSNSRSIPPADSVQATIQSATSIIENDIIVYLSIQAFPYIYKFHQIFDSPTLSFYANAIAVFLVSSKNGLSLDFISHFTAKSDRSSMGTLTLPDSTVDTTVFRDAIAVIEAKTRSIYWNNLNGITSLLSVLLPNIPLLDTQSILQSFAIYTERLNVEHTKTFVFWDQVLGTDKSRKNDAADRKRAEKLYWEVMKKLVFVFTLVGCDVVVIRDKQVKNLHHGGSNLFSYFSLSLRFDKNLHSTTRHVQIEEMTFLLLSMLQSLSFIVDYFDSQGYRFDSFEKLLDDVVKELIIPTNKSTDVNTLERPIGILSRLECGVVDGNMFLTQSSMSELPIIDPSKSLFHIRLVTRMIQTLPLDYLAKYISTFVTPIFSIPLSSSASSQSILQSLYDSSHLLIISCFDAYKIHVVRQFWFWYFEYCLEEFNRDGDKFVLYKGVGGVVKGLGGVKVELQDDEQYKVKVKDVADGIDSRDGNEKALDYILQRLKKELEDWKGLHVRLNRLSPSKPTPAQPIVDISDHTSMLSQTQSQTPSYLFLLKTIASLTTVVPIQYFYKLQLLLTDLLKPENWDVDVNWGVRYIDLLSIVFAEVSKTGLKLDVESFNASNSHLNRANSANSNEPSPSASNPSSPLSTESSASSTSPSALSSNLPYQPVPQREQPQNPYTISPSYLAQLTADIDFTNPNPNPNNPSSLGNPIDSVDLLRREEISRWWNKLVWEYLGYREAERLIHSDELKNLNGKKQERDGKSKIDARL